VIQIIALCLALLLVTGCDGEPQPTNLLHIHTSANEAGELWVSVNGGSPLRLLEDAQGYRSLVSSDGDWLAVEVRLMSDLEVVRLFRRDGNRFVATEKDVTTVAWRQAAAAENIEMEALIHTKTRFSGWNDEGTTLWLELSAVGPGEQDRLETVVAVPLDSKP